LYLYLWKPSPAPTCPNVDPDAAVEVGMGATLALWGDRLQLGGVNLMAADEASGR
jgi:hypothetical protein